MPVYLDHNATTPLDPSVAEVMQPYLGGIYGNPSSVHRYGRLCRDALEQARFQVAKLVSAEPNQVVFTSGGTEANNLAIKGVLMMQQPGRLAISAVEHASLRAPAEAMGQMGWPLDIIGVNSQGQVPVDELSAAIQGDTRLVSIMAANNETGVLQDMESLVAATKARSPDILFHSDACQMAGKLPLDFSALKLDLMSLSSHKLYGPQGAGALIIKRNVDIMPQIVGGGQEKQKRSGTENLVALVGFGAAAELAQQKMAQRQQHVGQLQQQLFEQLKQWSGVEIFSAQAEKLPNTLQFALRGIDGETLLMQLDRQGFAVSSGSACHSGSTEPSDVLLAMSVDADTARSAIRVSFGEQNTHQQVSQFIEALQNIKQQYNLDA